MMIIVTTPVSVVRRHHRRRRRLCLRTLDTTGPVWLGTDRHQSVWPCLSVTVLTTGRQRTMQEVDTVAYLFKATPSGSPHFPVRAPRTSSRT